MAEETPLVHRTVRTGGILLTAAALQFLVVLALATDRYPGFQLWSTRPSLLASGPFPWGAAFDASLLALGCLAVVGLLLIWSAFDARPTRSIGLFLLLVGGGSAAAFGALSAGGVGSGSAALHWTGYVGGLAVGLGLVALAFAMHRQDRWRASRAYTLASGVLVLATAGVYASGAKVGLGPGGLEILGLGAAAVWLLIEGAHIALLHRFAPGLHVKVAAA